VAVAFGLLQAVPYGWAHPNPPVIADTVWPSPEAEAIARAACYDCHSNETDWPVYSYVAPMSWLVRRDVEQGRHELNFSLAEEIDDDAAESVLDGSMPPRGYRLLHPGARLSDAERQVLVDALTALAAEDDASGRGRGRGRGRGGD
jgi:hypothetical protein